MNNRGQSITAGIVAALVIALMVAGIIFYSISKSSDRAGDLTSKLTPSEREQGAVVCERVVSQFIGDKESYCETYQGFGKDKYFNCEDISLMYPSKPEWANKVDVDCSLFYPKTIQRECLGLHQNSQVFTSSFSKVDAVYISGFKCEYNEQLKTLSLNIDGDEYTWSEQGSNSWIAA